MLWIYVVTDWRKDFESFRLNVESFNTGVDLDDDTAVAIVDASWVRSKWFGDGWRTDWLADVVYDDLATGTVATEW